MSRPLPTPNLDEIYAFPIEAPGAKAQRVNDLAARILRTLGIARALAACGRRVDLAGMQDGIGVLCAQTLDLPNADGRCMLPVLRAVLAQLESLTATLQQEVRLGDRADG